MNARLAKIGRIAALSGGLMIALAPPAAAAEATRSWSVSTPGANAYGNVRFYSTNTTKFTIVYTLKDTSRDGLCVRLEYAKFDWGVATGRAWVTSPICSGAGSTYGPYGRTYDTIFHTPQLGLRVCLWSTSVGRATVCSAWSKVTQPYPSNVF